MMFRANLNPRERDGQAGLAASKDIKSPCR